MEEYTEHKCYLTFSISPEFSLPCTSTLYMII